MSIPEVLAVDRSFFGDSFCGCGVITLSTDFVGVPTMVPWDNAIGVDFDVLTDGGILFALAQARRLVAVHMATT